MNKPELNTKVGDKFYALNGKRVDNVSDIILEQITKALCEGHRVEIRGFGGWRVTRYLPWVRRQPNTGELFTKNNNLRIRFKVSSKIKQKLLDSEV